MVLLLGVVVLVFFVIMVRVKFVSGRCPRLPSLSSVLSAVLWFVSPSVIIVSSRLSYLSVYSLKLSLVVSSALSSVVTRVLSTVSPFFLSSVVPSVVSTGLPSVLTHVLSSAVSDVFRVVVCLVVFSSFVLPSVLPSG